MRALTYVTALALLVLVCFDVAPAAAVDLPAGFETESIADGLDLPVDVAFDPDGRMFVAEKRGKVKIVDVDGSVSTLLDFSGHVADFGDRGLLGIALDADYDDNGYLYLLYVRGDDSENPTSSRLTRVTIGPGDSVSPETVIVGKDSNGQCPAPGPSVDCIPADSDSHAIGTVVADDDGTLWLGSGDGFYWEDGPFETIRTGNPNSLAGKILHVDRDGNGLPAHALCPGNPLTDTCAKVFAMGFRNPFRFVPRDDGKVVVGDVGNNVWEELDIARSGGDYGWPCYEGDNRTEGYSLLAECQPWYAREGTAQASLGPAWKYQHEPGLGGSIIAGPQYDGDAYPAGYRGSWFVGDYVRNWVQRVTITGDSVSSPTPFIEDARFVTLDEDPDGNLVLVSVGFGGSGEGTVERVVYTPGNAAPVVSAAANPTRGEAPLAVQFSSAGTSDPNGDPLSYSWDFGDGSPSSTAPNPSHTYTARGDYVVRLRVSDGRGRSGSAVVRVTVGGPRAEITSPADGGAYDDGALVTVNGEAFEEAGPRLPGSSLRWELLLVHGTHNHPGTSSTGDSFSFTAATDHDADSYYRVTLTATDSAGGTDRKTITLRPRTVNLTLRSDPPGAPLSYAGQSVSSSFSRPAAVGFRTSVGAPSTFQRDGRSYELLGWSDGGAQVHPLTIPDSDLELVARYRDVTPATPGPGPSTPQPPIPALDRRSKVSVTWPKIGTVVSSLRGTATDLDGVRSVQVALVLVENKGCRWWSSQRKRVARAAQSCERPVWITAKLGKAGAWAASLGGRLPKSKYTVLVRVRDRAGATTDFKYRSRRLGR